MAREMNRFGSILGLAIYIGLGLVALIALFSLLSAYQGPRDLWAALTEGNETARWIAATFNGLIDAYRAIAHRNPLAGDLIDRGPWAIDLALISMVNLVLGLHFAIAVRDMRHDYLRRFSMGMPWQTAGSRAWEMRPLTHYFFGQIYQPWQAFTGLDFFLVVFGWVFRWYRPLALLWVADMTYLFWSGFLGAFEPIQSLFPGFVPRGL